MQLSELYTNQRLFIEELISRGASWRMVDTYEELVEIKYKNKVEYILDRFSSVVPFSMVKVTADKHLAKSFLKNNNILTPVGEVFTYYSKKEAFVFAKNKYPLVLKPNWGSHGDNVYVNIQNEEELEAVIDVFLQKNKNETAFILEEYVPWNEYRFLITSLNEFAIVHREPASVIGDGFNNIKQLVKNENEYRINLKKEQPTSLCPIVLDHEVNRYLSKINKNLDYCPKNKEKIYLRSESNLAKGGRAINVTNQVHKSYVDMAKKALKAFTGMPCVGLDVLCKDISTPLDNNYRVIEVNSSPGLAMHTYPSEGGSENVAKIMVNVIFKDFFN